MKLHLDELLVSVLVDPGAGVTTLHGEIAPNEETSQTCALGGGSTPILQAQVL